MLALPPRPAVCLIELRDAKAEPFLIRTQDLRRRLQRLLGALDPTSKRLNLREFARGVRYRLDWLADSNKPSPTTRTPSSFFPSATQR